MTIRWLDQVTRHDGALAGGKGANLGDLLSAGFPVPNGFVVTTEAYRAFVRETGLAEELAALVSAGGTGIGERVAGLFSGHDLPSGVAEEIREAYSVHLGGGPVAVRSSATAEDLPEASFAGQQDTYLWLTEEAEVHRHIRMCWASLYTSRAIMYRLKNGIEDEGLSMAVAVQKMVSAETAGVAMTMNPSTGDRSKIVIDASWGIGEAVVSGHVTPDNIMVDKVMLSIVSEHIGDKHIEMVPEPGGRGLIERPVDVTRREIRCLTDEQVRQVAELAKRAERYYGTPQDIEWAIDRDLPAGENLLLLQARPETVHSNRTPEQKPVTATIGVASLTSMLTGQIAQVRTHRG